MEPKIKKEACPNCNNKVTVEREDVIWGSWMGNCNNCEQLTVVIEDKDRKRVDSINIKKWLKDN